MSRLSPERKQEVIDSFHKGNGLKRTARLCNVNRDTVKLIYRNLKEATGKDIICPCGRPVTHQGWCAHRYESAGRTKKVRIRKPYISVQREKLKGLGDGFKRDNRESWIKYMLANPYYFEETFGIVWSYENVQTIADEQFSKMKCQCCGQVFEIIRCMPINEYDLFAEGFEDSREAIH